MPPSQGKEIPSQVAERAFTKWTPSPSGCRISTYSVASHGYAQIGWGGKAGRGGTTAHRAAWTFIHGQIEDGMTIDHRPTCDRRCVNVDHLRKLSNFENGRRTHGRDWPLGQCINGHSNEHLRKIPSGRTKCGLCDLKYAADHRARKKQKLQISRS